MSSSSLMGIGSRQELFSFVLMFKQKSKRSRVDVFGTEGNQSLLIRPWMAGQIEQNTTVLFHCMCQINMI